jgi:hypothetical protein|tara:strand:+ start:12013 stop:12177 length:165 start_codon:yes stop_codon:yes gene_type:complete
MEITLSIFTYAIGFVSGMYVLSQLESGIKSRIRNNETLKNLKKYDKKNDNSQSK